MAERRRVVITGRGIISPLGNSWAENVAAMHRGTDAVRPLTVFESEGFPIRVAGQVEDMSLPADASARAEVMLRRAAKQAIADADLDTSLWTVGLSLGLGRYPVASEHIRLRTPLGEDTYYQRVTAQLAAANGLEGPLWTISTACSSGNDAIGLAFTAILAGQADAIVCGAADSQLSPVTMCEFVSLGVAATSTNNEEVRSRPFDRHRKGLVLGEGAGVFVIESLERARARHAPVRAELLGYGSSMSAYSLTREQPDGTGLVDAMTTALADAELNPDDIDYINAHGTGTIVNDPIETIAIKRLFRSHARRVPISSTKSMTGHLCAAGAAVELAFCLMTLGSGVVPPTINLSEPDPLCDLDYVPNIARHIQCRRVMSNAAGFGGQNSSLIVGSL